MKKCSWTVVILVVVMWAFMPGGVARAACTPGLGLYVNCSTGVGPPTTVAPNTGQEAQAFCNNDDIALGGGYEVLSPPLPLPKGVLVIIPENSFHFTSTPFLHADGWQVVLQNICNIKSEDDSEEGDKPKAPKCPSVDFRVCVSCQGLSC
jgi:hypothetical protein